jgi:fructose-1,6-bisphosphatase II
VKGKNLADMVVAVLDRPRHDEMIRQIRATGAGARLLLNGDVAGGISATSPGSKIDMCVGVGGTSEASSRRARSRRSVVWSSASSNPRTTRSVRRRSPPGHDLDKILDQDDLVEGDNTFFVAAGVTDGVLVDGVRRERGVIYTDSIVLRSRSNTIRRIQADHRAEKWS